MKPDMTPKEWLTAYREWAEDDSAGYDQVHDLLDEAMCHIYGLAEPAQAPDDDVRWEYEDQLGEGIEITTGMYRASRVRPDGVGVRMYPWLPDAEGRRVYLSAEEPAQAPATSRCGLNRSCSVHGFYHGGEAEELRQRVQRLIERAAPPDVEHVYRLEPMVRLTALQDMLAEVDARDSTAYLEAKKAEDADEVLADAPQGEAPETHESAVMRGIVDLRDCEVGVPDDVRDELMRAASPTRISYHWLCAIYQRGRADAAEEPKGEAPSDDYTQAEQECRGCMGPCGRCEEEAPASEAAAFPPRPTLAEHHAPAMHLVRYGRNSDVRDDSPSLLIPMADGYWTPWHIAEAKAQQLEAELAAIDKVVSARYPAAKLPGLPLMEKVVLVCKQVEHDDAR